MTTIATDAFGKKYEVCTRCRTTKRELEKGEYFEAKHCVCETKTVAKR